MGEAGTWPVDIRMQVPRSCVQGPGLQLSLEVGCEPLHCQVLLLTVPKTFYANSTPLGQFDRFSL